MDIKNILSDNEILDKVSDNQTLDKVPDNQNLDKVPDNEILNKVPDNEILNKVPDNEILNKVPDNEILNKVPDNQNLDKVPDNEILNKIKKSVSFFEYDFFDISKNDLNLYQSNIKLLEYQISPKLNIFGNDHYVYHGKDYFSFFRRLGSIYYFMIQYAKKNLLVGTACAILRKYSYDTANKKINIPFWYLCDLKIDKKHQGKNITIKLFRHMYYKYQLISKHCYFICFENNHAILKIFNKINSSLQHKFTTTNLLIYAVNHNIMTIIENLFICAYGYISYLSLSGKKDFITMNQEIPQYFHLQHGKFAEKGKELKNLPKNSIILFCFPSNCQFESIMNDLKILPVNKAHILSTNMDFFDWHDILTSDI
ncbi:hypothetical protein QKC54_gp0534 [Megavirus baoshan]|uniref:Uncharacterized protein n=1 Tax=Megavirus baoshan TaxID=2496520 RepID=A0A3S8UWU3_9VIRU|nr:hypothetical protein QKC54_gp0534 [Megavirus baoshan]AZL89296.1 hypothetical protein Mb0538 [Megavirus baoshan]